VSAAALLTELRTRGVRLRRRDDQLVCVGALPEELTPRVRDSKNQILEILDEEAHTFRAVLGRAGTGKTYMVRSMAEADRSMVLTATTGIAAVNLGSGTINALLGYFDTESLKDAYVSQRLHGRLRKLADSGLTHVVVDEVSMMDGDQLTLLVRAIDFVNRVREGRRRLRLTVVGDWAQLPPVKAPFAFESPEWPRFEAGTTVLTEVKRQTDRDFIEALNTTRRGDGRGAVGFFRPLLHEAQDTEFDGTTIMGRNDKVAAHNQLRLDKLPGARIAFHAYRWGRQLPEWRKEIPDVLELKEGAVVMILANRRLSRESPDFVYANGDLGTLLGQDPSGQAVVRLQRNGEDVPVETVEREAYRPTGRKGAPKEVDGLITYMPLRCAYATTAHKGQGLTLDRVQVDLRDYFLCNPGSLYVALSRARTAQGLRLVGTPSEFIARCQADPRVRRWL